MNHTQLLNNLIAKHNLKAYLEIGVQSTAQNFDKIKVRNKVGVDPCFKYGAYGVEQPSGNEKTIIGLTSDDFFSEIQSGKKGRVIKSYDLIFLDGLHHADQVERDFNNSLACLSDNGFIVLHDTFPDEEQYTTVPRQTKKWFGNVYQFILNLHSYDGIDFITYPFDCGCTVVWKDPTKKGSGKRVATDWDSYLNNKHLFNVRDVVE